MLWRANMRTATQRRIEYTQSQSNKNNKGHTMSLDASGCFICGRSRRNVDSADISHNLRDICCCSDCRNLMGHCPECRSDRMHMRCQPKG